MLWGDMDLNDGRTNDALIEAMQTRLDHYGRSIQMGWEQKACQQILTIKPAALNQPKAIAEMKYRLDNVETKTFVPVEWCYDFKLSETLINFERKTCAPNSRSIQLKIVLVAQISTFYFTRHRHKILSESESKVF